MHAKKIMPIILTLIIILTGCESNSTDKDTNSSSTQSESQSDTENPDQSVSESQSVTENEISDQDSNPPSSTTPQPENDYDNYTQTIYEAIGSFDWLSISNKPFLGDEMERAAEIDIHISDINSDNVPDIILSSVYDTGEMSSNEIFTFVGGEIQSIGGFYGALSDTEGTHNADTKSGTINLYKNKAGERLFIQWVKSKLQDINLVLCEVFTDTIIYNPVVGMRSNEQNQGFYLFENGYPNSSKEFIMSDFWEVVQSVTQESYNEKVAQCEQDLQKIGDIEYKFVTSYSLNSNSIESSIIADKICEEIENI